MNHREIHERCCAICGSGRKKPLFHQNFAGGPEGSLLTGYDVVVCAECGFGYADGIPGQPDFDEYYQRMSKYEYEHEGGRLSDFDSRRFPVAAEFIKEFAPRLDATVLDIGCSNGGMLLALRQIGYTRLLGLDPSLRCAETAERLYSIRVVQGTLSQLPPGLGRFDVVLLGAVLEHVRELEAALAQVRRLLPPGGLLYVEVPDVTRFASTPDAPFQEFSVEHVNYFSVVSLQNLLGAAGFEMIASRQTETAKGEKIASHELKAMFRMLDGPARRPPLRDSLTEPALAAYIGNSRDVERRLHEVIDPLVESRSPIIVWGVGTHTQRLLATSRLAQANICAFVDSNPRYQGKPIHGIPVLSPAALKDRREPILISSRFFQKEIEHQIREVLDLSNELHLLYAL